MVVAVEQALEHRDGIHGDISDVRIPMVVAVEQALELEGV